MRAQLIALLALSCAPADSGPRGSTESQQTVPAHADLDEALARMRALSQAPPGREPRLAGVLDFVRAKDLVSARTALEEHLAQRSTGEAEFLLGYVLYELKRPRLALQHLESALAFVPAFFGADQVFYYIGKCSSEEGLIDRARAAFEADLALFPKSGDAHFQLALLDVEEGRVDGARAHLERALALFERPRDRGKVHARLADMHLMVDELELAKQELLACVTEFPHYEAFYKLSHLAQRLGEPQEAAKFMALHDEWKARQTGR